MSPLYPNGGGPVNRPSSPFIPFAWLTLVLLLDQASKALVEARFALFEIEVVIPGLFNLTHLLNTGAAFGFLAGEAALWRQLFFAGMATAALIVLFFAFRQLRNQGSLYGHAIGLIAGGALGNLIDRLRLGAVVDFLDFYLGEHHWPAFNVADSAICVGVGLFFLASCLYPSEGKSVSDQGVK